MKDLSTYEILDSIRKSIEAESISYDEILTLQTLYKQIPLSDTILLEWAGVEEQDADQVWNVYQDLKDFANPLTGDIRYKDLGQLAWRIKEKYINSNN